jgi:hypothetical protein
VAVAGTGTVTANPPGALTGSYIAEGGAVQLTAHPAAGMIFLGWSGDTTARDTVLGLTLHAPHVLTANFSSPLLVQDVLQQLLTGVSSLTAAQIRYVNQLASKSDSTLVDVGDFLAWVRSAHPRAPSGAPRASVVLQKASRP